MVKQRNQRDEFLSFPEKDLDDDYTIGEMAIIMVPTYVKNLDDVCMIIVAVSQLRNNVPSSTLVENRPSIAFDVVTAKPERHAGGNINSIKLIFFGLLSCP